MRQGGEYISEEYAEKAQGLYKKYHGYENDLSIPLEERREKMFNWWTDHYALLKEMGMNRNVLEKLVSSEDANFREGALETIDLLKEKGIPMVIISSSGIGDAIPMFLQSEGRLHEGIFTLTNQMIFDENGVMIGVKEPIIHSLNKSEVVLSEVPEVYEKVKDRGNVILLGDSPNDLKMIDGFNYDEIIRIGFLNKNIEENKKNYLENFDVVITGDGDMGYVNELLGEILA